MPDKLMLMGRTVPQKIVLDFSVVLK